MLTDKDVCFHIWNAIHYAWVEKLKVGPNGGPAATDTSAKVITTPLPATDKLPTRLLVTSGDQQFIVTVKAVKKGRGWLKRRTK